MGILNSNNGCGFSDSDARTSALPTLPSAFSISNSKFPGTSLFSLARGGVGRGGDFGSTGGFVELVAPPSELISDCCDTGGPRGRWESVRSSAGGRDFISFALAKEIKGTVDEEITGAIVSFDTGRNIPFASKPMLAFTKASTHALKSTSFSALKIWIL